MGWNGMEFLYGLAILFFLPQCSAEAKWPYLYGLISFIMRIKTDTHSSVVTNYISIGRAIAILVVLDLGMKPINNVFPVRVASSQVLAHCETSWEQPKSGMGVGNVLNGVKSVCSKVVREIQTSINELFDRKTGEKDSK